jgi:hypothetical protein
MIAIFVFHLPDHLGNRWCFGISHNNCRFDCLLQKKIKSGKENERRVKGKRRKVSSFLKFLAIKKK